VEDSGRGFNLQESAEHDKHHHDKETEGKERVLRSSERQEHDFDCPKISLLSPPVLKIAGVNLQKNGIIVSEGPKDSE
jgi:hypothetical protein